MSKPLKQKPVIKRRSLESLEQGDFKVDKDYILFAKDDTASYAYYIRKDCYDATLSLDDIKKFYLPIRGRKFT